MLSKIKKITAVVLITALLCAGAPNGAFALNSQTLWETSFETDREKSEWTFVDLDGDEDNMAFLTDLAYEGKYALFSDAFNRTPDNAAVGPLLNISNSLFEDVVLSWYVSTYDTKANNQFYSVYAYVGNDVENITENDFETDDFVEIYTDDALATEGSREFIKRVAVLPTEVRTVEEFRIVIRNYNTSNQDYLVFDNFSLESSLESELIWSEDFEEDYYPGKWTFIDKDGDRFNWIRHQMASQHGDYGIFSNSARAGELLTPKNYAVSPVIEISDEFDNLECRLFAGAQIYAKYEEQFSVYIYDGTETPTADNIEELLSESNLSETLKTSLFTLYRVDLDDYAGKDIRIIICHTGNADTSTENKSIYIDNISITGVRQENVEEVSVNAAYPAEGTAITMPTLSEDTAGVTLSGGWFLDENEATGEYEGKNTYLLKLNIKSATGYRLTDSTVYSLYVDGEETAFEGTPGDDGSYIIEKSFEVTHSVGEVSISSAPTAQTENPVTVNSVDVVVDCKWFADGEEVEQLTEGKIYTLKVTVTPADKCVFDENTVIKFDGTELEAGEDGSYTAEKEYNLLKKVATVKIIVDDPDETNTQTNPSVSEGDADSVVIRHKWYNSKGAELTEDETFEYGKEYRIIITVSPSDGFEFDENTEIYLQNKAVEDKDDEGNYTGEYTIIPIKEIANVNITVDTPCVGANPAAAATDENGVKTETSWTELAESGDIEAESFAAGKTYKMTVNATVINGYVFAENPVFTINGEKAVAEPAEDGSYRITKQYEAEYDIIHADVAVEIPVDGAAPAAPELVSDEGLLEITEYKWTSGEEEAEGSFEGGNVYNLSVSIKAADGYSINENTVFTFNGIATEAEANEDGSFTVSAEFQVDAVEPQTETKEITVVNTGITFPAEDEEPVIPVDSEGFTVDGCFWTQTDGNDEETEEFETFGSLSDYSYVFRCTLKANSGYVFNEAVSVPVIAGVVPVVTPKENQTVCEIEYDFSDIAAEETYYTVEWRLPDDVTITDSYKTGDAIIVPAAPEIKDKVFDCWTEDGENGVTPVAVMGEEGLVYIAKYVDLTEFPVEFVQDGEVIGEGTYTVNDPEAGISDIPETIPKEHYTVTWEGIDDFDYTTGGKKTIYAVSVPEKYKIEFVDEDDKVVFEQEYTVETQAINCYGQVPSKEGYTGKWELFELTYSEEVVKVKAVYTPVEYTATFIAEDNVVAEVTYTVEDTSVEEPEVPEKEYYDGSWEEYTLEPGGITVKAVYTAVEYTATFIAEDNVVAEFTYTVENASVEEPEVPEKEYYDGSWEEYEITPGESVVINAVYTPITFYATFMADGEQVGERTAFTVETVNIDAPQIPGKTGYSGVWEEFVFQPNDIVINAVYTANEYTLSISYKYSTDHSQAAEAHTEQIAFDSEYSVKSPEIEGYTADVITVSGKMDSEGKEITVYYTPNEYTLTVEYKKANGETAFSTYTENVSYNDSYDVLSPELDYYSVDIKEVKGVMDSTSGKSCLVTYTPIVYYIRFMANGKQIGRSIPFTAETESVDAPEVPAKTGYKGEWEEFALVPGESLTINAKYTPITYYATFVADGRQIGDKVPFTVESKSIKEPSIPSKEGYTAKWSDYTLQAGDITINAVYTEIPNPTPNAKITVKSGEVYKDAKVTVTAKASNVPSGYYLAIYDGGSKPVAKGTNTSVTYELPSKVSKDKTLTVKIIDANGKVQKDGKGKELTAKIEIKVKTGFFNDLIAFFRNLFGANKETLKP